VPDLHDLDHFDEGLPVNPLPASEVRRRGDRMRRRNTVLATVGGVVAAAVFIGTPAAIVVANQSDGDDNPPVAQQTTSSPSPDVAWVQEVPADFPLGDGFPRTSDGTTTEDDKPSTLEVMDYCGIEPWSLSRAVDAAAIDYKGASEDRANRTLALYSDEEAAAAELELIRRTECPAANPSSDAKLERGVVNLDLGTEESYVFTVQVRHADGSISGLTVTEIGRTGNALYFSSSYGSAGGGDVVELETQRMLAASAAPLGAMCQFSAEPCEVTSTQATEPAPEPPSSSPPPASAALADFPLDLGYPETNDDGSPVEVTGKPGLGIVELCGDVAWDPGAGTTDVIGVEMSIPEDYRGRTLAIYESEDAADAAVEKAGAAVGACRKEESPDESGGSRIHGIWENGGLGDKGVVWTTTYRGPNDEEYIGRTVYHLVRVGNAVYASYESNEGGSSNEALAEAVQSAIEAARPIVEAMRKL